MKLDLQSFRPRRPRNLRIRDILLLITAGLTLMIALLAARDLYLNAQKLSRLHELRAAIDVSNQLFEATSDVSIERDLALALLQTSDASLVADLTSSLAESRRAADTSVQAALGAIDGLSSAEIQRLRDRFMRGYAEVQALRPEIDRALGAPVRQRPRALSSRWETATTAMMTDVESLWVEYIRPFTNVDAVITQHLRYRHFLRTITDYAGRERSIIGQILSENQAPSAEQTANLLRGQGVLEVSWRTSRLLAEQSGLYSLIAPFYVDAESHYATLHDMTRELFYRPGVVPQGAYPIGADLWFELSSQAADSLAALRNASRVSIGQTLDSTISGITRAMTVQAVISLLALLLCAASFWMIVARVIRPINGIVKALMQAMRGEAVDFALNTGRDDEIGQLAQVLDAFRRNSDEIRRTAVERDASARALEEEVQVRRAAELKAQAQLERLNLLHQISRAIGERQELSTIFHVALGSIETQLPADFTCAFLRETDETALSVVKVGAGSEARAAAMAMTEGAQVEIGRNGLSRCMTGRLVHEPELAESEFAFPRRLANGGLTSFVAAPLQVESQVFGALIVAREAPGGFSSGECEFLRQLSEHVALAAHQSQLNTALQRAYDDLRQTQEAVMQHERLRALGQMASGIAHDINNALSPIALYTESLLHTEPGLSQAGHGKLEIVQRAIDDASRTIARMNEFYRKRDTGLALTPVPPNTLVRQVLDLTQARWRDMAQQRGQTIEMRTELADPLPAIMGVESELREALTNLVFNAIDALPGGGAVTMRTKTRASATLMARGPAVQIEIADNGVGMDEATRQRCLEPFFTTKGERGTGLGLAMVYGMVQRHGAEIEIDSAPGRGTTIRLIFAAAPDAAAGLAPKGESRPGARLRLLIIDDDPVLLRSLRDVLESDGHVVSAFSDGAAGVSAFAAAREGDKAFDAVITDLGMPVFDGRRVAASIKQISPEAPVILLTGWGERLRAEEDIPAHVDCVLSKPPKIRELRAALAQWCAAERQSRTARIGEG